ncbi:YbaB/EbfC family nucleoid-associated protein [Thermomonospora echinospora]|nr:YbaB/EbfC family nucleoid-associated protein [Thermomonospora echinospora]
MKAEDLFGSSLRDLQERMGHLEEVQDRIRNLAVTAESEDKLISATVGPGGRLYELKLDPRVRRLETHELAERIVTMVNEATELLQEATAETVQTLMPEGVGEMFTLPGQDREGR